MHAYSIAMTVYDNKKKINQSRDYLKYTIPVSCYTVDILTYKIIVIMPVGTKTATAIIVEYHLL